MKITVMNGKPKTNYEIVMIRQLVYERRKEERRDFIAFDIENTLLNTIIISYSLLFIALVLKPMRDSEIFSQNFPCYGHAQPNCDIRKKSLRRLTLSQQ